MRLEHKMVLPDWSTKPAPAGEARAAPAPTRAALPQGWRYVTPAEQAERAQRQRRQAARREHLKFLQLQAQGLRGEPRATGR